MDQVMIVFEFSHIYLYLYLYISIYKCRVQDLEERRFGKSSCHRYSRSIDRILVPDTIEEPLLAKKGWHLDLVVLLLLLLLLHFSFEHFFGRLDFSNNNNNNNNIIVVDIGFPSSASKS